MGATVSVVTLQCRGPAHGVLLALHSGRTLVMMQDQGNATADASPIAYSVYCDESCHLLNDHLKVMVLGSVWCPSVVVRRLSLAIRVLKLKHGLRRNFESKWTKVSASKVGFYLDLVDLFFDDRDLHFRGVLVADKSKLDHALFDQSHDDWYYKMYYRLLQPVIRTDSRYRIYLDIKDTKSSVKIAKLHDVLCNANRDFDRRVIEKIQTVRSHEVELLQLADLLIGAIGYKHRGLSGNAGKLKVLQRILTRSGFSLERSTILGEMKFNFFIWSPQQRSQDFP